MKSIAKTLAQAGLRNRHHRYRRIVPLRVVTNEGRAMTSEEAIEIMSSPESRFSNRKREPEAFRMAMDSLRVQPYSLVAALQSIADDTNPDSPEENYRADDREGCLDTVFATATRALAAARTGPVNGDG